MKPRKEVGKKLATQSMTSHLSIQLKLIQIENTAADTNHFKLLLSLGKDIESPAIDKNQNDEKTCLLTPII